MGYLENSEHMEHLMDEIEELRDQLDSIVNDVGHVIGSIGETAAYSKCRDCIGTAKELFRIIEDYGDENAQNDALERFSYLTGISLND